MKEDCVHTGDKKLLRNSAIAVQRQYVHNVGRADFNMCKQSLIPILFRPLVF